MKVGNTDSTVSISGSPEVCGANLGINLPSSKYQPVAFV